MFPRGYQLPFLATEVPEFLGYESMDKGKISTGFLIKKHNCRGKPGVKPANSPFSHKKSGYINDIQ
jgi:hypothetical protein